MISLGLQRIFLLLGSLLVLYSGADLILLSRPGDYRLEERFCKANLCDSDRWYLAASNMLWRMGPYLPDVAVQDFGKVLERDPNAPFNWANLGDAFDAARKPRQAVYCFRQAVEMAPHWPPLEMRAINYYFRSGNLEDREEALKLAQRVLAETDAYDTELFGQYMDKVKTFGNVLQSGLPEDPRPAQRFLQYLVQNGKLPASQKTWAWLSHHNFLDASSTNAYVAFLLARRHPGDALSAWQTFLGKQSGDYAKTNFVFNGDFEAEPGGSPLDWTLTRSDGVEAVRDGTFRDSGDWSLHIQFDGTRNATDTGVKQIVILPYGFFELRARIRTEGLTTDQGVRIKVVPLYGTQQTWTSPAWRGTTAWTSLSIPLVVTENRTPYSIQVVRDSSLKIDRLIRGEVWLDSVSLKRK